MGGERERAIVTGVAAGPAIGRGGMASAGRGQDSAGVMLSALA